MSSKHFSRPRRGRSLDRYLRLFTGLTFYGLSIALMVSAGLGVDPWDVLHQGTARRTGVSIGAVITGTSFLVLLAWIPLRQRPGIGTVANAILVGLVADMALVFLPQPRRLPTQLLVLSAGILVNAIATGLYIGAGLGPGPRDGLMTGLAARTGWSIRLVRTSIELTVLSAGWLLGGTVGVGTVLYALAIGPLAQVFIPRFSLDGVRASARSRRARHQSSAPPGARADESPSLENRLGA